MSKISSSQPRISIGVPVYNCEEYLHLALDSLLAQSFPDFEIIISDNASTDGTENICRKYAAQDSRIRYVRQTQNIGVWANFRFVLEQSKGEFFMWSAADDERSFDCLEFYLGHIQNSGGVFSTYAARDRKTGIEREMAVPILSGQPGSVADIRAFLSNPCPSFVYGLYRRSIVLELFPKFQFDWADCFYILSVVRSAGFVCIHSPPKYFAGTFDGYVVKPTNGRYVMPFTYFSRAFPIVAGAGAAAVFSHLSIFAIAARLNYRIAKQAVARNILAEGR